MKYGYTYTYDGETTKKVDVLNLGATPFYVNDVYIDSNERKLVKFTDNTKELYFTGQGSLDFVVYKPEAYKPVANYPVQKYQTHELLAPLSKVTMYYADDKAFSSGDDSGSELIIDSLWATQSTAHHAFNLLNGFEYTPIKSSGVYADTTIQLGDVIEVNDLRQTIINIDWTFDGKGIADIETPQNNEENYDDPYNTLVQNQFKRKVSLGDSYQGVTIDRQKLQMLYSPDGTEENATGKYYADLNKGMAFQYRDTPLDEWNDWLYFDKNEKVFKLALYSKTDELISGILLDENGAEILGKHIDITANEEYTTTVGGFDEKQTKLEQTVDGFEYTIAHSNGSNLLKNSVMQNGTKFWEKQPYIPPSGELYPDHTQIRDGYLDLSGGFVSFKHDYSYRYAESTPPIEINPNFIYRFEFTIRSFNFDHEEDIPQWNMYHYFDENMNHISYHGIQTTLPPGSYSEGWYDSIPNSRVPMPANARYVVFSALNASLEEYEYSSDGIKFWVDTSSPGYTPNVPSDLKTDINSWSLTKDSVACITGVGKNEQIINIDPNDKYTISFDYAKPSSLGSLDIYYIVDGVKNYMIQQSDTVEDAQFSIELSELGAETLTIGIDTTSTNESTSPMVANLMVDRGVSVTWSTAVGELYTTEVLIDDSGVTVKGNDGLSKTAMTPNEFAHYYDGEKRFFTNKDEANFDNIVVTGRTLELSGGIKFVNMADRVVLVNLRSGN